MSVHATQTPNIGVDAHGRRLQSWKEIAAYLGRDVTTVRRWEKREALPVPRLHLAYRSFACGNRTGRTHRDVCRWADVVRTRADGLPANKRQHTHPVPR